MSDEPGSSPSRGPSGLRRRRKSGSEGVRAVGFDHLVIISADVERSLAFYLDELGMEPVRVDEWRRGEVFFPSVRLNDSAILDLLAGTPDGKNVDHICLVIGPVDLAALAESGRFDVAGGPAELFGARGQGQAFYVRDPDGNVIELRHYGSS